MVINEKVVKSLLYFAIWFEKNLKYPFLGFDKFAELLIKNGADVNAVAQHGQTVLMNAAKQGKKECFTHHPSENKVAD